MHPGKDQRGARIASRVKDGLGLVAIIFAASVAFLVCLVATAGIVSIFDWWFALPLGVLILVGLFAILGTLVERVKPAQKLLIGVGAGVLATLSPFIVFLVRWSWARLLNIPPESTAEYVWNDPFYIPDRSSRGSALSPLEFAYFAVPFGICVVVWFTIKHLFVRRGKSKT